MQASVEEKELDRAKRLMAMGQMAASLAHEIRNPLGSMELYCTLLKKDLAQLPDSLQLADQIHTSIRRLERIINNCLQFSRDLSPRCVVVNDVMAALQESVSTVEARLDASGIELELSDHGDNNVFVDPHLVNQAVLNLLLNAIEALEASDTSSRRIWVLSDRNSLEHWRLSVIDNGPGIPTTSREKVFDPFVTTKSGGTGLGLAIVHTIVTAHRGQILVEDAEDGGICVTMEFPNNR